MYVSLFDRLLFSIACEEIEELLEQLEDLRKAEAKEEHEEQPIEEAEVEMVPEPGGPECVRCPAELRAACHTMNSLHYIILS